MKTDTITPLPPAANLTQILRACCAEGAGAEPALTQPFTGPGKAGSGVVSVATDGATICLWTRGNVGGFKGWATQHPSLLREGEDGGSPLGKFREVFAGAGLHPLPLATRRKDGLWSLEILTGTALILDRHHQILRHADSCYFGPSRLRPVDGRHPAVSLRATVGKAIINGVIFCAKPD